jgi:hypothetical protein
MQASHAENAVLDSHLSMQQTYADETLKRG